MYEIEHELEMWAFGTRYLGAIFLMIANLAYANMQLVKEEREAKGTCFENIELWWKGPIGFLLFSVWKYNKQIKDK